MAIDFSNWLLGYTLLGGLMLPNPVAVSTFTKANTRCGGAVMKMGVLMGRKARWCIITIMCWFARDWTRW